jgi:hypothetical protein
MVMLILYTSDNFYIWLYIIYNVNTFILINMTKIHQFSIAKLKCDFMVIYSK